MNFINACQATPIQIDALTGFHTMSYGQVLYE